MPKRSSLLSESEKQLFSNDWWHYKHHIGISISVFVGLNDRTTECGSLERCRSMPDINLAWHGMAEGGTAQIYAKRQEAWYKAFVLKPIKQVEENASEHQRVQAADIKCIKSEHSFSIGLFATRIFFCFFFFALLCDTQMSKKAIKSCEHSIPSRT